MGMQRLREVANAIAGQVLVTAIENELISSLPHISNRFGFGRLFVPAVEA